MWKQQGTEQGDNDSELQIVSLTTLVDIVISNDWLVKENNSSEVDCKALLSWLDHYRKPTKTSVWKFRRTPFVRRPSTYLQYLWCFNIIHVTFMMCLKKNAEECSCSEDVAFFWR